MEAAADRDTASMRPALVLLGTALVVFAADQASKAAIVASMGLGERIDIVGDVLRLWHVRNEGAAFSLLQGQLWLFVVVSVLALGLVAYFYRSFRDRSGWLFVVLGLVLAGTLGNLVDRVRFGYVVDFVSVGLGEVRFPTFNVADSSVVVGIIALVAYLTFFDRPGPDGEEARAR